MRHTLLVISLFFTVSAAAQQFTLADSLRGTLSAVRACFDVTYYDLDIAVDLQDHSIAGNNSIYFKCQQDFDSLQIDLFDNMTIDSITYLQKNLHFSRLFNAVFVTFPNLMKQGEHGVLRVTYHGKPIEAKNAPWDGGFVWDRDAQKKPWVGVACEGVGASLWWPNKDHLSDEPDSMRISCTVPVGLMCVANGELENRQWTSQGMKWTWKVSYPINNYNVTLNIADYAHFSDYHVEPSGDSLKLDYYVLQEHLDTAKKQFEEVHQMLDCYEDAFGPYPFYRDGYALVETSYLGMEHQGAIAYGNRFGPGYLGRYPDGMDFDYIIVHESGHEWWGNSVSMKDAADMWIHESFCTYAESVYVECRYGYDKMLEYLRYQRNFITNRSPIYGTYGVNKEGNSGDMYYKGAWMIHTLRNVLDNDTLFRSVLKGIQQEFAYKTVDGEDIVRYVSRRAGKDLSPFFNQYLKFSALPVLEYRLSDKLLEMRWKADAKGFEMPMVIDIPSKGQVRAEVGQTGWMSVVITKKDKKHIRFRDDLFLFVAKKVKD